MRRTPLPRLVPLLVAVAGAIACWQAEPVEPSATGGGGRPVPQPPPKGGVPGSPADSELRWTTMSSGTIEVLHGVWGSGPTDVYAVGNNGTILRYDGASWTRESASTVNDHLAVWGSGAGDVFVVGANGRIFHSDGSAWSPMSSPTAEALAGVWGASPTDVWAVGSGGTILHYDGAAWSAAASPVRVDLSGVWGRAADDVWAVGGEATVVHWDGVSWTVERGPTFGGSSYTAVVGRSPDSVFVVGYGADLLARGVDGWTELSHDASGNGPRLQGVWTSAADTTLYAAAEFDGLFRWNGTAWTAIASAPRRNLDAVWGSSATDVFAVGWDGVILHGTP